jgi:hypothetical protein
LLTALIFTLLLSSGSCGLASRLDVEQALGRPVVAGDATMYRAGAECDFSAGEGQIAISVQHLTEDLTLPAEIVNLTAALPGSRVREITVSGVQAFLLDLGDAGAQLHVIRGRRDYLMISVLGLGCSEKVVAAAEALAKKALSRM